MSAAKRNKIAIIGAAGTVGSALAFYLCTRGTAREIVLIDVNANRLSAHLMDIEQAASPLSSTRVKGGTYADLADTAIVVVACSAPDTGTTDRSASAQKNLTLVREAARHIRDYCPHAVVITMTNPVDVLNHAVWQETGLERARCLGFSTNDTVRFRRAIAEVANVSPRDVYALVVGEHGPNQVPLFSSISVKGERLTLSADQQSTVNENLRGWFRRYIDLKSGRTTGWTSAIGATTLIEQILEGFDGVISTSVVPAGEYGLTGLSIGLPVRVGSHGVLRIEQLALTDIEAEALERASEAIKRSLAAVSATALPPFS